MVLEHGVSPTGLFKWQAFRLSLVSLSGGLSPLTAIQRRFERRGAEN